jgi:hypothetical protein
MSISAIGRAGCITSALVLLECIASVIPYGQPTVAGALRAWEIGEVAGPIGTSQTFTPGADGLRAVSFSAVPVGQVGDYAADVRLARIDPGPVETVAEAHVPVARLVEPERYRLSFPERESAGQTFLLTISVPDAPRGSGIALLAAKGAYDVGVLTYNGVYRWGALQFQTEVARASYIARFRARWRRWPPPVGLVAAAGTAAIVFQWLAVYAILVLLATHSHAPAEDVTPMKVPARV